MLAAYSRHRSNYFLFTLLSFLLEGPAFQPPDQGLIPSGDGEADEDGVEQDVEASAEAGEAVDRGTPVPVMGQKAVKEVAHGQDQKQKGGEVVILEGGAAHEHPGDELGQKAYQEEGGLA